MTNVKLSTLALEVPVSNRFHYFDMGTAPDLNETLKFLSFKHRKPYAPVRVNSNCTNLGYTIRLNGDTGIYVYVFYKSLRDPLTNIRIRAHEETHALQKMSMLPYLQNEFEKNQFSVNL